LNREEIRKARDDLGVFSSLIGRGLQPYQLEALTYPVRTTVIVAPRQTGKSFGLANRALHGAFARSGQRVLIVSAGEEASKRLLAEINQAAAHPLLRGSVLNESASLLLLSNGSEIRSVPASERQIRGWTVDLLIVDEAALVPDEVLLGAALPTTAARPEAQIILTSTPWAMEGAFYRSYLAGIDAAVEHTRSFQWRLLDAPWITPAAVEHARAALPPLRFRAEFEGEFVGASDALFPPADLRDAVCSYRLVPPSEARGEEIVVGVDWGRAFDRHAVCALGLLDDYGANEHPILFVPWLETSQRPYSEMVEVVASIARPVERRAMRLAPFYSRQVPERLPGGFVLHENGATLPPPGGYRVRPGYSVRALVTEMNGVGAMPSEELARRLGRRVLGVHSSQRSKEDAYSRLRALLSDHRLVLPDDVELIRQLQGLTYSPTASGGLTIEAADPNVHDDLADALSLAVSAVPHDTRGGVASDVPEGIEWIETAGGVRVPKQPRPRRRGAFNRAQRRIITW
jgi:hypothetical protein